jgi:hypothetical protein
VYAYIEYADRDMSTGSTDTAARAQERARDAVEAKITSLAAADVKPTLVLRDKTPTITTDSNTNYRLDGISKPNDNANRYYAIALVVLPETYKETEKGSGHLDLLLNNTFQNNFTSYKVFNW